MLTYEVINTWKPDEAVLIHGGMGVGKTYWVLHTVCSYYAQRNQKVLMVFPRIPLREQIEDKVTEHRIKNLVSTSYQHINEHLRSSDTRDDMIAKLNEYACIICDEYHYWIQDASFTPDTELSYDVIMHQTEGIQKILLSATPQDILRYIRQDHINYKLYAFRNDYRVASKVSFFSEDTTLDELIIDSIRKKIKTLVFIQSAKEAADLYCKYKDHARLITSTPKYAKYTDSDAEKDIQRYERFDTLILISTSKMEVGVTMRDYRLKRIIIKMFDPLTITQCAGRKRMINANDTAELFIYNYSRKSINGRKKLFSDNIIRVEEFRRDGHRYIDEYGRYGQYAAGHIIVPTITTYHDSYDDAHDEYEWTINAHRWHYQRCVLERTKQMLETAYQEVVLQHLNPSTAHIIINYEDYQVVEKLEQLLDSNGFYIMPEKSSRKVLIDILNIRQDGRQKKQRKILNQYLQRLPIPFVLEEKEYYDSLHVRHRHAWQLRKL